MFHSWNMTGIHIIILTKKLSQMIPNTCIHPSERNVKTSSNGLMASMILICPLMVSRWCCISLVSPCIACSLTCISKFISSRVSSWYIVGFMVLPTCHRWLLLLKVVGWWYVATLIMGASFFVFITCDSLESCISLAGMILRNNTYLKVYKCWQILPILKAPTIKMFGDIFKNIF